MRFQIGPYVYSVVVSDRPIYDEEGNELEGACVEARRLIILSRRLEPDRREEILGHEILHAWEFFVPKPRTDEERAQLFTFVSAQFQKDLDAQGGREALSQMVPKPVPHLGKPEPVLPNPSVTSRETFGRPDQFTCATCEAIIACGSIHHGEPFLHEFTRQVHVERWFHCEACGRVQVWREICDSDGTPSGVFVSVPKPRVLHGAEASRWLVDHPMMESV